MGFNTSRRSFLAKLGIGVGSIGAVAVACGKSGDSYNDRAADYQKFKDERAAAVSANGSAGTGSSGGHGTAPVVQAQGHLDWREMDRMHKKGVEDFVANASKPSGKYGGQPLDFKMEGDVKVFNLNAVATKWEVRPGETKDVFAYNGVLPGPEIRVTEGEKVRIVFKNELPESTAIHWHGQKVPNNQDGVPFVTQPVIEPGATYTYEFVANPSGSHMYHSHHNAMEQVGKGLLGAFIVDPKDKSKHPKYDKEYTMVLNDTLLGFTLNGKSFPATLPLTAKLGEKVLVRYMNEGLMNHPMHLHGMPFQVVAKDGWLLPQPYMADTLDVAPGDRFDVIIDCDAPGLWAFHCHTLSHAESPQGMFGLVTVLIVEDPNKA